MTTAPQMTGVESADDEAVTDTRLVQAVSLNASH
jgi:hypothetical protein